MKAEQLAMAVLYHQAKQAMVDGKALFVGPTGWTFLDEPHGYAPVIKRVTNDVRMLPGTSIPEVGRLVEQAWHKNAIRRPKDDGKPVFYYTMAPVEIPDNSELIVEREVWGARMSELAGLRATLAALHERDEHMLSCGWGSVMDYSAKRARANRLARERRARKRGVREQKIAPFRELDGSEIIEFGVRDG